MSSTQWRFREREADEPHRPSCANRVRLRLPLMVRGVLVSAFGLLGWSGGPIADANEARPVPGVRYIHQDQRFDGVVVTDEGGRVVERAAYTPWGQVQGGGIPGPVSARFGFSGNQRDGDCLLHFHARWYDPCIGRFVSPDPMGQFASSGLFAGASPVDHADPDGMVSEKSLSRLRRRMNLLHLDETGLMDEQSRKKPDLLKIGDFEASIKKHKASINRRLAGESAWGIAWTTNQLSLSEVTWREGLLSLAHLPPEMLLNIAENVARNDFEDLGVFCMVCKKFNQVARGTLERLQLDRRPQHESQFKPELLRRPGNWLSPRDLPKTRLAVFRQVVANHLHIISVGDEWIWGALTRKGKARFIFRIHVTEEQVGVVLYNPWDTLGVRKYPKISALAKKLPSYYLDVGLGIKSYDLNWYSTAENPESPNLTNDFIVKLWWKTINKSVNEFLPR